MPSNGRSLLYGISISNVPDDRLDELCSMCSTGGRASTGGCVVTGVCVRYSVAVAVALWGCGCGCGCGCVVALWPMVVAVCSGDGCGAVALLVA